MARPRDALGQPIKADVLYVAATSGAVALPDNPQGVFFREFETRWLGAHPVLQSQASMFFVPHDTPSDKWPNLFEMRPPPNQEQVTLSKFPDGKPLGTQGAWLRKGPH